MLFEWDESKRRISLAEHHVDFQDANQLFDGPLFERTETRHGESRIVAIGLMEGIEIVAYVMRGNRRQIIFGNEGTS